MKQFCITSTQFEGQIIFRYDDEGYIEMVDIQGTLNMQMKKWLFLNIPLHESVIDAWKKKSETIKVTEVPVDLSFLNFWNKYAYKVGDKKRCEKLWNKLSDGEKTKALQAIPRYNQFVYQKNIDKVYPERYLSQGRFENDF